MLEKTGAGSASTRKSIKEIHGADRFFRLLLRSFAVGIFLLLGFMILELVMSSWPILKGQGFSFLSNREWNPVTEEFGALSFIYGTVISSLLALAIAVPVSVGVAIFLAELAPEWLATGVGFLVQMLAAIPSVVYGLWGIFVLAPWLREHVQPWLGEKLGFIPLFQGPPFGVGMMAAGVILAIMVIPTISAICREVFQSIPLAQREGALALGATRWESIYLTVLRGSVSGMIGAIMLGFGRALGETMAVTMVIGNRPDISLSLFSPAQTMASVIANEYAEAVGNHHVSALSAVGLSLFLVSLVINGLARFIVWRVNIRQGVV